MLNLCRDNDLAMLNGRTDQVKQGNLTFVSKIGCNVIDYPIVSTNFYLNHEVDLNIEYRAESAHMLLVVTVVQDVQMNEDYQMEQGIKFDVYKRSEEKKELYLKRAKDNNLKMYLIGVKQSHKRKTGRVSKLLF